MGQWWPRVVRVVKDGFKIEPTEDDIVAQAMLTTDRAGQTLVMGIDCDFVGAQAAAPWLLLDVLVDARQEPVAGGGFTYTSGDGQSAWSAFPRKGGGG